MSTKKFLRFFLILTSIILGTILILGVIQPKDVTVSRSTVIKTNKPLVFDQMVHFKNWHNWSPWKRLDSSMADSFAGTDGEPGSIYHWTGDNRKTGEANIKNLSVAGTQMNFSFELLQPSQNKAGGMLRADDSAGITKATFSFTNHFDYPWNAMLIFMNLDKTMGKDLENGLNYMKEYIEQQNTPAPKTDSTASAK